MDKDKVYFEDVTALNETEMEVLCEIDGKQIWIQKLQIYENSEVQRNGDQGKLVIPLWFAKKKELI